MQALEKNIIKLLGNRGKQWLKSLPEITNTLGSKWQLGNIKPVENMSWNYVAKAKSATHGSVVLKVSCDEKFIHDEMKALKHFSEHGMVELIEYDADCHAMLLHQAIPGRSLRHIYLDAIESTINYYGTIVNQLVSVHKQNHSNFKPVSDWLKVFNRTDKSKLPAGLLDRAIDLKNKLLASSGEAFVLHGDLHHGNILSDGDSWMAIDPKGIVGEVGFEAACFDFIHKSELGNSDVSRIFEQRSKLLASVLNIDHERLKDWVFVRLILGACWMLEDGGKADLFLEQAKRLQ